MNDTVRKVRVLIVDDSAVVREVMTRALSLDPQIEVIGAAADPIFARQRMDRAWPDVILLDVDNGPDGLSRPANDRIYSWEGLAAAKAALKPRGILAIWSAGPDASFTRRLRDSGFEVEEAMVRARPGKGPKHVIWFARA